MRSLVDAPASPHHRSLHLQPPQASLRSILRPPPLVGGPTRELPPVELLESSSREEGARRSLPSWPNRGGVVLET